MVIDFLSGTARYPADFSYPLPQGPAMKTNLIVHTIRHNVHLIGRIGPTCGSARLSDWFLNNDHPDFARPTINIENPDIQCQQFSKCKRSTSGCFFNDSNILNGINLPSSPNPIPNSVPNLTAVPSAVPNPAIHFNSAFIESQYTTHDLIPAIILRREGLLQNPHQKTLKTIQGSWEMIQNSQRREMIQKWEMDLVSKALMTRPLEGFNVPDLQTRISSHRPLRSSDRPSYYVEILGSGCASHRSLTRIMYSAHLPWPI